MSTNEEHESVRPQPAAFNGVDTALDAQALHNLAGFFDVLIQMDFAKKQRDKEGVKNEVSDIPSNSSNTKKVD